MKPNFNLFVLAVFLTVIQFACKKIKTSDITHPDITQCQKPSVISDTMLLCHNQTSWDSAAIHNALIGKWQWEYIASYWNPETSNCNDFRNL